MKFLRALMLVGMGLCLDAYVIRSAEAARNAAGTMSLYTPGNPVVSGTTISSTWANNTLSDFSTEITDSLSRSGKGGMLAPLRGTDGSVSSPSLSFTNEPGSGIYRIGANDFGFSVNGVKRSEWTTSGETVIGTATANSSTTGTSPTAAWTGKNTDGWQAFFVPRAAAAAYNGITQTDDSVLSFDQNGSVGTGALVIAQHSAGSNGLRITGTGSTQTGTFAVTGATTLSSTLAVTSTSTLTGGATIGSSGTAITQSNAGTVTWNPGTVNAGTCASTAVTVTGATSGDPCMVGWTEGAPTNFLTSANIITSCFVTGAGVVTIKLCNPTGSNIAVASGNVTHTIRFFNH